MQRATVRHARRDDAALYRLYRCNAQHATMQRCTDCTDATRNTRRCNVVPIVPMQRATRDDATRNSATVHLPRSSPSSTAATPAWSSRNISACTHGRCGAARRGLVLSAHARCPPQHAPVCVRPIPPFRYGYPACEAMRFGGHCCRRSGGSAATDGSDGPRCVPRGRLHARTQPSRVALADGRLADPSDTWHVLR
jgi:hypothetical protein